ncbi:MAG: hypothetical protein Q8O00_04570 [Holophaga sp.]|nr:hypothetical protein [Holophaga sp.]
MNHEAAFTKAFILSEKRARFIQGLENPKRRKELLEQMSLHLPYVPKLGVEVPISQDFPEELEKLLVAKGAGTTCHVTVDGLKIDGRELPLRQALDQICMHEGGAILSCIPGRLAYYKPASPGQGVILECL